MKIKHKGFTLIELLIVIVVIGILAAMMILSSTEVVATTKATVIINNLATIRKAILAWYTDNLEIYEYLLAKERNIQGANPGDILGFGKYLDDATRSVFITGNENMNYKGTSYKEGLPLGMYGIFNVEWYRSTWYVGYRFKEGEEAVKEKVKARRKSLGLIFSGMYPNPGLEKLSLVSDDRDVAGDDTVWMYVLGDFNKTRKDWTDKRWDDSDWKALRQQK